MRRLLSILCVGIFLVVASSAAATPATQSSGGVSADDLQRARDLFKNGTELAKKTQWAEALQAFEQSELLRRHAITTYNIGVCQRALGQYTQARSALQKSLDESAANSNELPPSLASEAKGYLSEIDGLLVRLDVTVNPPDARVLVDGRPLEVEGSTVPPTFIAGLAAPGGAQKLPTAHVTVVLGPGTHLFTLARQGFGDVVLSKTYGPGSKSQLALAAEQLPATLHVASNMEGAAVALDGLDVGLAPVDLTRPSGSYSLLVRRDGYIPYKTQVNAEPGAKLNLSADLSPERTPITKRWWFWTGAAAIVASAIILTYVVTRPAPERPAVDTGGLNWALKAP